MLICLSYDIFASCTTKHFESGFIVSLSLPQGYLELEVTGNCVNRGGGGGVGGGGGGGGGGYGLENPARFCFYGTEKAK